MLTRDEGDCSVSIHAPREGCDWVRIHRRCHGVVSIHAPREGCDLEDTPLREGGVVSIHAPRGGCDFLHSASAHVVLVSIHAPQEGCDVVLEGTVHARGRFNSRTPGGVRLSPRSTSFSGSCRFNSRTPGGVRLLRAYLPGQHLGVSIHAPREGCDLRVIALSSWR